MKNFLGVYSKRGRDAKASYEKITMNKDIKKLVEVYEGCTGSDVKVQKTPGAPGTTLSKIDLEESYYIDKYRSLWHN